jgi:hypothetical protein
MSSKRIVLDRTLVIGVDVASEEHVALEGIPSVAARSLPGYHLPCKRLPAHGGTVLKGAVAMTQAKTDRAYAG